ncbi:MAG: hypothetical protein ACM31C_33460 [Acidobacteriota bacterium]
MERLDKIAERNQRALRDTKIKLAWVAAIVVALVAIAIGVSNGLAKPHVAPRPPAPAAEPAKRVDGVLLRRAP